MRRHAQVVDLQVGKNIGPWNLKMTVGDLFAKT